MAPQLFPNQHYTRSLNTTFPKTTTDYVSAQWVNPADIFSVLLLLGPGIVQQAVAQLAGHQVTPVALSFGWVAYSVNALQAVVGVGRLMPETSVPNVVVIDVQSGHTLTTKSWVLGALFRVLEYNVEQDRKGEQPHPPPDTQPVESADNLRSWEALRLSVFDTDDTVDYTHGVPCRDWVWYSGFLVIILQLIIAIIPLSLHGEWATFAITVYGNCLALLEGSLPQWRREKWASPKSGSPTTIITQGNGSRHAILILGKRGVGLDLNILATGAGQNSSSKSTRLIVASLTVNWVILLITAAGLRLNTWYLLAIGIIGSIQNLVAGAALRSPSALGIHIRDTQRSLRGSSVKAVLRQAEELYPGVGIQLALVFFPGSMRIREDEVEFWRHAQEQTLAPNQWGIRMDRLPSPQCNAPGEAVKSGIT